MADETTDLTIEQLASEIGLPYSTIRMYQHRGLLPAPAKRGRVGYYGPDHVGRLRLIGQLQERGYSLAAIKDLVDTWQDGRTLTDVLRLEAEVAGTLAPDQQLRLAPTELATYFPGIELSADEMQRAYQLGLVTVDGNEIVVRSPVFLEVGSTLATMGVPISEILDEYELLRAQAALIAERFTAVFERNVWRAFADKGMPATEIPELTESLRRLTPLAERIVQATLRQALTASADTFLADQAKALQEAIE